MWVKTIDAWTPLDLASMVRIAGKYVEDLYVLCYLDPTSHMHATGAGMTARMEHVGDAWTYKVDTSPEARMALHLAHVLRSEEHTSELQSLRHLVCRLL